MMILLTLAREACRLGTDERIVLLSYKLIYWWLRKGRYGRPT